MRDERVRWTPSVISASYGKREVVRKACQPQGAHDGVRKIYHARNDNTASKGLYAFNTIPQFPSPKSGHIFGPIFFQHKNSHKILKLNPIWFYM